MEKKIVDYLHYYIGQQCLLLDEDKQNKIFTLTAYNYNYYRDWHSEIKPLLSKLEDMPDEVIREFIHFESLKKMYADVSYELERGGITIYYTTDVPDEAPCPQSFTIFFNALTPAQFHFLLMRGYDLFALVESGLAIDKKTLK